MKTNQEQYSVIVYMFTNLVNNKSYIGTTVNSLDNRWYHHKYDAFNNFHIKSKFHRAIRKYPLNVWRSQILYNCTDAEHGFEAEIALIHQYDTFNNGYNTTTGGDCGPILLGENNGMYGKTHSIEVKEKLAMCASERFKNKSYCDLYGVDKSNQLKQTRSTQMKQIKQTNPPTGSTNSNAKRYHFVDPNGKEYFTEGNLREFCKQHELEITCVIAVAKGRQKHHKKWTASIIGSVHHL